MAYFHFQRRRKQDGIHCQGPTSPPWRFLYLTETKSCKWEEGGGRGEGEEEEGGEKVSLKTHATARAWVKMDFHGYGFHLSSNLSAFVEATLQILALSTRYIYGHIVSSGATELGM